MMRQLQIIWGAIVTSTVIYAGLAFWFAGQPSSTLDSAFRNPLVLVAYVAALAAFITALVARRVLTAGPRRIRMILGLAIFESCAIFGLMAAFFAHDWRIYLAPWSLALIGFVLCRPNDEEALAT
jgi:hypothetical protein